MAKVLFERRLNNRVFRIRDDGREYVVDNGQEKVWRVASSLEMLMAREIERLQAAWQQVRGLLMIAGYAPLVRDIEAAEAARK